MHIVGVEASTNPLFLTFRSSHIYSLSDLQPVYVQYLWGRDAIKYASHEFGWVANFWVSSQPCLCPEYRGERPAAGYLSVRPDPGILGSSYLVDAGVQVYHDVDGRNKDLGGDEDDD